MAIGKTLGTFETHSTSIVLSPTSEGHFPDTEMNLEGTINGEIDGKVIATMHFKSKDGNTGTYTVTSLLIGKNGDITSAQGRGTTTADGVQQWTIAGVSDISDKRSMAIKGTVDLNTNTVSGEMFERN